MQALATTTETDLSRKPCGALHFSPNYGGDLMVVQRSFPAETTVDEIKRGVVRAEFVSLSADGRGWVDGWHHEPQPYAAHARTDTVYVEKHTTGGAVFHGWIDAESRRIVQAG